MLILLAIVFGIFIGQHLTITPSAQLTALIDDSVTQVRAKAVPAAKIAATKVKTVTANFYPRLGETL